MKLIIKLSILLVLLLILIIIFIISRKKQILYYKHPLKKLGDIQQDIYKNYNFTESSNFKGNWVLYIPRTYNTIEDELRTLDIPRTKTSRNIFGINDCDNFVSKNGLWSILLEEYGVEFAATLIPRSYLLYNETDIDSFKKDFIPDKAYMMKKNIQRKEGLKITTNLIHSQLIQFNN